jgi:tRNA threonylcarbamoyladenosine biosynthesis protein TsaE
MTLVSSSADQTIAHGRDLARRLKPGDVVAFTGDLGAGKTCMIKGICLELQVPVPATSPTFTLVNQYQGTYPINHIDLYRLKNLDEALAAGLHEYFSPDTICLVEWADKIPELIPENAIRVHLTSSGGDGREIEISGERSL